MCILSANERCEGLVGMVSQKGLCLCGSLTMKLRSCLGRTVESLQSPQADFATLEASSIETLKMSPPHSMSHVMILPQKAAGIGLYDQKMFSWRLSKRELIPAIRKVLQQ